MFIGFLVLGVDIFLVLCGVSECWGNVRSVRSENTKKEDFNKRGGREIERNVLSCLCGYVIRKKKQALKAQRPP
jgi:hypothetical protein